MNIPEKFSLGITLLIVLSSANFIPTLYAADTKAKPLPVIYPSLDWANKPWTGDNRPYQEIHLQIDQLAAEGKLTISELTSYQSAWQKTPYDPIVLFRWAYADKVAVRNNPNLGPHMRPGDGAFEVCPDPHTYEYERIRFLINWNEREIELLPLANRLVKQNPKDYIVQFLLAERYSGTDSPQQEAASIARVQKLMIEFPQIKPELYGLLGGIYYTHWSETKNSTDGKNAIYYYDKYLELAPSNAPWRKQALFLIKNVETASR